MGLMMRWASQKARASEAESVDAGRCMNMYIRVKKIDYNEHSPKIRRIWPR